MVIPELKRYNGGNLNNIIWTQDGAPPHTTRRVINYLDSQFGENVVSRRSIQGQEWPARSPDLNPLDFSVWGNLGKPS